MTKLEQVSKEEAKKLAKGICPDCAGNKFLEGPHAGLAVNVKCDDCGSKFNICWPFTPERI